MSVLDDIPKNQHSDFLKALLDHYVENGGLGAMPKPDFDALIVHLFLEHSDKDFNSFDLSDAFKIKESRLKSLLEVAAVKFEKRPIAEIWMSIIQQWKDTITEVDRIESGEVRFKLENPAYYRYIQREVRSVGSTAKYDKASEAVTLPLGVLFKVLDLVYGEIFNDKDHKGNRAVIEDLIKEIKSDLFDDTILEKIKKDKKRTMTLTKALSNASNLSSIGRLVKAVFFPA